MQDQTPALFANRYPSCPILLKSKSDAGDAMLIGKLTKKQRVSLYSFCILKSHQQG